ncbi:MAG TPA: ribonuclease Z [Anaerolineaceae bacterium]|nr:ribonuclease Z [Anaerolineaceae bacterium]HQC64035.1 ribonuclease Z [Anaerolineaceae bacterium]
MFELVFLGTSASAPSIRRGLSSLVVMHDEYRFMVDCGEGTQRQILRSGVGFKRLNHILLTHGHLDHILGLAGLLSTFMRWEAIEEVNIYGTQHTLDRVHDLLYGVVLRGQEPGMPLNLIEVRPGPIFRTNKFEIRAFPVDHRGSSSLGYVFEEFPHRPFLTDAAERLDIPPGPWRKDLVQGKEITLQDGRVISPDMVLGEARPGTKLSVVGDVGKPFKLIDYVRDSDAIVTEATYLTEELDMAEKFGHSTAEQSAQLAKQANAKMLILNHVSRRYRDDAILAEAQAIFPNTHLAADFDTFQIKVRED